AKHVAHMLLQSDTLVLRAPISFHLQLTLVGAAFRADDGLVPDGPHFRSVLRLDSFRIVPEINSVDALVVEPQPNVVRMVGALTRARFERIAAGDDRAFGG